MIDDEIDRPDVTLLMPQMKSKVLKGVNILFTHVIPTNQKKDRFVTINNGHTRFYLVDSLSTN